MVRIKAKNILLVSPRMLSEHALMACKSIKHVTDKNQIFPALFEVKPDLIIFDVDFISEDTNKIIRRIRTNAFYDRTKICCYKSNFKISEESLLKSLGVDDLVNVRDVEEQKNDNFALAVHQLFNQAANRLAV